MKKIIAILIFLSLNIFASIKYTDGRFVTWMVRVSVNNYTNLAYIPEILAHTNDFCFVKNSIVGYPAGLYQRVPNLGFVLQHPLISTNWIPFLSSGNVATNTVINSKIIFSTNGNNGRFVSFSNRATGISNGIIFYSHSLTNGNGSRFVNVTNFHPYLTTNGNGLRFQSFSNRSTGISNNIINYTRLLTNGYVLRTNGNNGRFVSYSNRINTITNALSVNLRGKINSVSNYFYSTIPTTNGNGLRFQSFSNRSTGISNNIISYTRLLTNGYVLRTNGNNGRFVSYSNRINTITNALSVNLRGKINSVSNYFYSTIPTTNSLGNKISIGKSYSNNIIFVTNLGNLNGVVYTNYISTPTNASAINTNGSAWLMSPVGNNGAVFFDNNSSTGGTTTLTTGSPSQVVYTFTTAKLMNGCKVFWAYAGGPGSSGSVTFAGSNSITTWANLFTHTVSNPASQSGMDYGTFSSNSYLKIKVTITLSSSGSTTLDDVYAFYYSSANTISLRADIKYQMTASTNNLNNVARNEISTSNKSRTTYISNTMNPVQIGTIINSSNSVYRTNMMGIGSFSRTNRAAGIALLTIATYPSFTVITNWDQQGSKGTNCIYTPNTNFVRYTNMTGSSGKGGLKIGNKGQGWYEILLKGICLPNAGTTLAPIAIMVNQSVIWRSMIFWGASWTYNFGNFATSCIVYAKVGDVFSWGVSSPATYPYLLMFNFIATRVR